MLLSDLAWLKWRIVRYPSIRTKAELTELGVPEGFGSDVEPDSSVWLASLSEALGEVFQEGIRILDYGCGNARYCNFLSERLANFTYYGIEPPGSSVSENAIMRASLAYGHKPYVKLGFIGDAVEQEALTNVNVVILGSIFTHLLFDKFEEICDKFRPVLARGGRVVFSVFTDEHYRCQFPDNLYQHKGCYSAVWYTPEMLKDYATKRVLLIQLKETFPAGAGHKIYCMTQAS